MSTPASKPSSGSEPQAPSPIREPSPLGFQWQTQDPFLFCVHHDDRYPAGNAHKGVDSASLAGRDVGMDFVLKDGFRMYHGDVVPGFPRHPHRGFETVTIVREGLLDHADSMGAGARYGGGDVQWLTAGAGIQHAEMFPLLRGDAENRVELFQIWLNLPARDKFAPPHFTMLWREQIPTVRVPDAEGRHTAVTLIAGALGSSAAPAPPPNSWAAQSEADVAIWTIALEPRAEFRLPAVGAGTERTLYAFFGDGLTLDGHGLAKQTQASLAGSGEVVLRNGTAPSEVLLLQGRPIGEPVARHGPFVMNSRTELQQAYADFQRTQFGGWPWPAPDPIHGDEGRFARHADGRIDRPA